MEQKIYRYVRSSSFSRRVLDAYRHRCAITGLQLELVVAPHILVVGSGVDNDNVSNGFAMSPTFHAAFDDGLIYLAYREDERSFLKLNDRPYNNLDGKRDARKELVLAYTEKEIPEGNLPANRDDWPDKEMVKQGNNDRNIYLM